LRHFLAAITNDDVVVPDNMSPALQHLLHGTWGGQTL